MCFSLVSGFISPPKITWGPRSLPFPCFPCRWTSSEDPLSSEVHDCARVQAGGRTFVSKEWAPTAEQLPPTPQVSRALHAGGTSCCLVLLAGWPYNFKGRGQAGKDWDWGLLPIIAHWRVSKSWGMVGGGDWARPEESLGAGQGGGLLRKPSIWGSQKLGFLTLSGGKVCGWEGHWGTWVPTCRVDVWKLNHP